MRLFIAVNFSNSVRDSIDQSIKEFAPPDPPWRWAHISTWHITLKFLGEVEETAVESLSDVIEPACALHPSFEMCLGKLGGFPNLRRPRVLFYHVEEGASELTALALSVDKKLHSILDFPRESRPFRAHATVARVKNPISGDTAEALEGMPALEGAIQKVATVDLVRSRLGPEGARYSAVKQFALI